MNPKIQTLLENLEFHEHQDKEKSGLFLKKLDTQDANGQTGLTAYIDFRKGNVKGHRFYTVEGINDVFSEEADVDFIPILKYFKDERNKILSIKPKEPSNNNTQAEITQPTKISPTHRDTILSNMVEPAGSLEKQIEIFKLYEEAKTKLLNKNDVLYIGVDGKPTETGKGKPHIKRSGWRKLARFFGLSCEIISKERIGNDKNYKWVYSVVAYHPSGARMPADGVASSDDKFFTKGGNVIAKEENIILKAQTVAFNRAISDLLGGGEVSAEEIEG